MAYIEHTFEMQFGDYIYIYLKKQHTIQLIMSQALLQWQLWAYQQ